MKKAGLVFFLLIIPFLSSAWSPKEWKDSLYRQIKTEAEKNFSGLFHRRVTIEKAEGIVVGQIVLKNVYFPDLGHASKIILSYNPVKYVYRRGDILPALFKITVIDGKFKVTRDLKGQWNIFSLFPPEKSGGSFSPPFVGSLVFKNCRVDYLDQPQEFRASAADLNGKVSLAREKIQFDFSARLPETVRVSGSFDPGNNKYEAQISSGDLSLEKWGNYAVPLPGFRATGGKAELLLRVTPPAVETAWPVDLSGSIIFHDGSCRFQSYELSGLAGKLYLSRGKFSFVNLKAKVNNIPVIINGHVHDLARRIFDLTAAVPEGQLYGQKFSGTALLSMKNNLLAADINLSKIFQGSSSAKLKLNFSGADPHLNLAAKFSHLDLSALTQKSPGIEGKADGALELSGTLNNLAGRFSAALSQTLIFGQSMESLSASYKIVNGNFSLEKMRASSKGAYFLSYGEVTRNLDFALQVEAEGLRVAGKGLLGKMEAVVNRFRGEVRGKLDQKLLVSPLRSIFASGEAILSSGFIGKQTFDRAEGEVEIGGGKIRVENAFLQKDQSILRLGGQTGVGHPTQLKISGSNLSLEDLKVLNHFLPPEVRDPKGACSIEVEVTGFLPADTRITSLAQFLALTARGKILLQKCTLSEAPVSRAAISFIWQDGFLSVPDCRVDLPDSSLGFNLNAREDHTIDGRLEGFVNLSHFNVLLGKYGKISGKAGLNLNFSGSLEAPAVAGSFWADSLQFNEIALDHISGSLDYSRERLTFTEPLLLKKDADLYTLSGSAAISQKDPADSAVDAEFRIVQADLASAYRLFEKLRGEFTRRFARPAEKETTKIILANLALPTWAPFEFQDRVRLYADNGTKTSFLKTWKTICSEIEKKVAAAEENLGGSLTGLLSLKGKMQNLSGKAALQIDKGYFRTFHFDSLAALARLKNGEIKIEKALLFKDKGYLSARGDFDPKGNLFLHLIANQMPLDILQVVFPKKEFKGYFNMNAGLDGPLDKLRLSCSATAKNIILAGINFDEAVVSATRKEELLYLHELSLLQGGQLSSACGSISLSLPGEIDLEVNLKDNAIGLLNLLTDEIRWLRGKSFLSAKVQGNTHQLKINGAISIEAGTILFPNQASSLRELSGYATLKNSLLEIKSLTGIWIGERTRGWPNPLGLAGTIDLKNLLAEAGGIDLNLVFSPGMLSLSLPHLYAGNLNLRELSLQGPFRFDFTRAPLLKGKAEIDNSVITIPTGASPAAKIIPLGFDLVVDLSKNVYATMGDVATLNLSNILMNLEISGEKINVFGDLRAPVLQGKILIKRGTLNIFNREFTVLSTENQKTFFPYAPESITENIALFSGESGPAGYLPELNLTSSVNVENLEKDASGQYAKKKVILLARLKGILGAAEQERGLKIALLGFTEDKAKTPPEMVPAAYSEQDLKVMLLPDFIKSLAGIGRPEETTQVDTNVVVADYISSRMQTFLFRSLERQAEQGLGLESLTLEYNLGPKVREAMGIKETTKGFEEEKPAWSVGFVKGFFDRIFIDVRYAQGSEQAKTTGAQTSFNYQLTYKISPIWSIIYYREPINLVEPTTGYQKVTLKAGLSLW